MSNYYNRQWRLPNNENKDKQSNYSMYIDVGGASAHIDTNYYLPSGTNPKSISFWLKNVHPSGWITTGYQYTVHGGALSTGQGFGIGIIGSSSGAYIWFIGHSTGDYFIPSSATGTMTTNVWYHIVVTYDNTRTNNLHFYLDGVKIDETNESLNTSSANSVKIGANATGGGGSGGQYVYVDGVCFFDYALSSSQVTTLYGSSSTGIGNPMSLSPKPVAYYPLGDQDSFNGSNYLVPNSSLKDYVFDFIPNGYINIHDSSSLRVQNLTISLWVNAGTQSNNYRYFLEKGNLSYVVYTGGTTTDLLFLIYDGSSYYFSNALTNTLDNNWHHIAFTYDGSQIIGYKDGVANTPVSASGTILHDTNPLRIGSRAPSLGNYPNGKMSNVQIFNTALPATGSNSVETLYNNGSPLTSMTGFTSLVSWYKLNASDTYDGTNWMIEDHAGSNDGTSSGMTQANLVQSDLSFTSGYSPYALSFDGTNEKIQYANGTIDLGLSSTETWWIKYSNSSATSSSIASAPVFAGFHILYEKSTNKVYYRIDSTNLYYEWVIPSTYFTDNLWHHYSIVRDDSLPFSSYIKLYIDGNLFGNPNAVNATSKSTTNTKITDWGGASAYSGIVADLSNIAVWNISLSSTEITEIFNSGVPSNLNNFSGTKPYSWWQLGSNMSYNSNWTILDEGTGNNNGSASNISEDSIVDGVASYANGTSSGMGGDEVVGDAPYSTANSLSVNMDVLDRTDDTPA